MRLAQIIWVYLTFLLPMPFIEVTLVLVVVVDSSGLSAAGGAASSALTVDVEVERLKPDVKGAR